MKRGKFLLLILLSILLINSCTEVAPEEEEENPVPTLSFISPDARVSHMAEFKLTVQGTRFISASKIVFDNIQKNTTYISPTELTCQVYPADISGDSSKYGVKKYRIVNSSRTLKILVVNPYPGGGNSNTLDFTVKKNHSFYVPRLIPSTFTGALKPALSISQNIIYTAWFYNDDKTIFFSRSDNYGTGWSNVAEVSHDGESSINPGIVSDDNNNVYLIWENENNLEKDIYISRSADNGETWDEPVNVSDTPKASLNPNVTLDQSGIIYAVWVDETSGNAEIYFSSSADYGKTWQNAVNISNTPKQSMQPAITVDSNGSIYIAWEDSSPGNDEIYILKSIDNGESWKQFANISGNSGNSQSPRIIMDGKDNIYVVWHDYTLGNWEIFFSKSSDHGANWSQGYNISNSTEMSIRPVISVDAAGNINVTWQDSIKGESNIYYSRSIDTGSSWATPLDVSNKLGSSYLSAIDVDSAGNIIIVWQGQLSGTEGILYTGSVR